MFVRCDRHGQDIEEVSQPDRLEIAFACMIGGVLSCLVPSLRSWRSCWPRGRRIGRVTSHAGPTRPPQAPEQRRRHSTCTNPAVAAAEARQLRHGEASLATAVRGQAVSGNLSGDFHVP